MKPAGRVVIVCLVILAAALPLIGANAFLLTVGTIVALNIIGATSLHLVIRTGHVSLGHAGFMGIGGYAAALTLTRLGWPFPLNIAAGAAALLCTALVARVLSGGIGRVIDSVRESERLALCAGVPVLQVKVGAFVLATALVGIQGGLTAHYLHYIDPGAFTSVQSLSFVVMNVIGGMSSLLGAVLGALFIVTLPELLRGYVEMQQVMFGVILIIVMAAIPGGLIELAGRVRQLAASLSDRAKPGGALPDRRAHT